MTTTILLGENNMNLDNMWKTFLDKIKTKINDIAFETWFSETKLIKLDENKATVLCQVKLHGREGYMWEPGSTRFK